MSFSSISKKTKEAMKGKCMLIYAIYIAYLIITQGINLGDFFVALAKAEDPSNFTYKGPMWVLVVTWVLISLVLVGYTNVMISIAKGKEIKFGDLIADWRHGFKAFLLIVVMTIYVSLWTCLLIIPGLVKALSYSMALYILAEDPSKGINQCIKESRKMMKGHKMDLFAIMFLYGVVMFVSLIAVMIPIGVLAYVLQINLGENLITMLVLYLVVFGVAIYWGVKAEVSRTIFYVSVSEQDDTANANSNSGTVTVNTFDDFDNFNTDNTDNTFH